MPYTAEVSRANPSCFLFLVDQSYSMSEPWGAETDKERADGVADVINRLLSNLVIKCSKGEGVRDYYNLGVIGYGNRVGPALGGALTDKKLVSVSQLATNPLRIEQRVKKIPDGAGGIVEQTIKFPVWFEPKADGGTPMCHAIDVASRILDKFIECAPRSYPPIVINITDGDATDGDPLPYAKALKNLTTDDGNVLMFNVHISSAEGSGIEFPGSETGLPDEFATRLFRMSSLLPPNMSELAQGEGVATTSDSRGFVFNGDMVSVIRFLDIGTRPTNIR